MNFEQIKSQNEIVELETAYKDAQSKHNELSRKLRTVENQDEKDATKQKIKTLWDEMNEIAEKIRQQDTDAKIVESMKGAGLESGEKEE